MPEGCLRAPGPFFTQAFGTNDECHLSAEERAEGELALTLATSFPSLSLGLTVQGSLICLSAPAVGEAGEACG